MADEASFAVRLIDKATRPAKAITRSLRTVTKALRATGSSGGARGSRTSGWFPGTKSFLEEQEKLLEKRRKAFESMGAGVDRLTGKLWGAAKMATLLSGALIGIGAALVTKGIVDAIAFAERARMAFSSLTGSVGAGEAAFKRAIGLSQELGLDVQDTAKQYQKLLAAQFSASRAETLIKLTTDLRAIGATAEETSSAIRAITQIKAKGRLQAEELVGQLAEAGIATTLVYEALGKQLGKTQDQVRKMISAGKVSADVGIAAIEAAILKKAHIHKAGEAGKRFADATLSGLFERLKNAPGQMFMRIAEAATSGGALTKMKGIVAQVDRAIQSIDPRGVAAAFERVLQLAADGVTLGIEFGKGFGKAFGSITKALDAGGIEAAKVQFRELGQSVAKLIGYAIEAAKWVGKLGMFLASDTGKWVMGVTAATWAFWKLTTAIGAVAALFGATAGTGGALAAMGSFGVGLGVIKSAALALAPALVGLGRSVVALMTPLAPALAVLASFLAAYKATAEVLERTGFDKVLGDFGASFAPAAPQTVGRGINAPAAAGNEVNKGVGRGIEGAKGKSVQIGSMHFAIQGDMTPARSKQVARQFASDMRGELAGLAEAPTGA